MKRCDAKIDPELLKYINTYAELIQKQMFPIRLIAAQIIKVIPKLTKLGLGSLESKTRLVLCRL